MASNPDYGVTATFDVMVEVRDGTRLATDVYRPADPVSGNPIEESVPGLLNRTPYGKRTRMERLGEWYAKRGYVVAIQDCRGRFGSEGTFDIFVDEPEDGYDTVEWLAERDYCDGSVGTFGTSYGAWAQSALATQDPPSLNAMFVNQGAANGREATLRHNGAFELRWLCWAMTLGCGFSPQALDDRTLQRRIAEVDVREMLANGPVQPGQSPLRHVPEYEEWVFDLAATGDATDDRWQHPGINFAAYYDEMADVPTVYAGGWYDSYAKATCDNFAALADRQSSDQFLFVGPWTHGWDRYPLPAWNTPYAGEIAFGPESVRAYQEVRLDFFDHYLKDAGTWTDQSPVEYFRMGTRDGSRARDGLQTRNGSQASGGSRHRDGPPTRDGRLVHGGEWRTADEWPPSSTDFRTYYAHEGGTLSTDRPAETDSSTSYAFDPRDPVPTIGGNCSSYISFEQCEESLLEYPLSARNRIDITGAGGHDQRTQPDTFGADPPYGPLEERNDVLVFRTPPLEKPVEIAGPIRIRVYGSTDGPDTDFTAKLIDEYPPSEEYPEGFALNITDSICRARYRGGHDEPSFVEPGEVYEFEIEPYPTATVFQAGHSIRLDVSSSNYPRFDVNHNTGGPLYGDREYRVATNTVYHERDHPTRVELPVQ